MSILKSEKTMLKIIFIRMKIIANISKVYTKNSVHSQTYRQ